VVVAAAVAVAVADVVAIAVATALAAQRNIFGLTNSGSGGESIVGEVADRSLASLVSYSSLKYSFQPSRSLTDGILSIYTGD
jgi:hypothetical protein